MGQLPPLLALDHFVTDTADSEPEVEGVGQEQRLARLAQRRASCSAPSAVAPGICFEPLVGDPPKQSALALVGTVVVPVRTVRSSRISPFQVTART